MGYWKKPGKNVCCKKECKPYIDLFRRTAQTVAPGGVVTFDECGPECGFDQCRNDIIVGHDGVYKVEFYVEDESGFEIYVNGVAQANTANGIGLLCLKCGDKLRLINTNGVAITLGEADLVLIKVN